MKKVLIVNPSIPEYRRPIFNRIGLVFNLTVLHSGRRLNSNDCAFAQRIERVNRRGPFSIMNGFLFSYYNSFDVVIFEANLRNIDRILFSWLPWRKAKVIFWGIGVSASYSKKFDENKSLDLLRFLLFSRSNAMLFYSDYPVSRWMRFISYRQKIFVANNTVDLGERTEVDASRKSGFVFIGSLYPQKGLEDLIRVYAEYVESVDYPESFDIIGEGFLRESLELLVLELDLIELVTFHGAIYDNAKVRTLLSSSKLCLSPGQAGLSVLTSMSCGTPFVTKYDSITGGERLNIKNSVNGFLFKDEKELLKIMQWSTGYSTEFLSLCQAAYDYYWDYRTPDLMVNGFIDAINYTLKKDA